MSVLSIAKGVKISPRKVAMVATLVRGRTVDDALTILNYTQRRSSTAVSKAIKSAQANAIHNHGYKSDSLVISEISVTHGPRTKRFRPVARGSANAFMLRTAHIRVVVDGDLRPSTKTKEAIKKETK